MEAIEAWIQGGDKSAALKQLLDLVHGVCHEKTSPADACKLVEGLGASELFTSALADALALATVEYEDASEEHERLAAWLKLLRENKVLSDAVLLERLEFSWAEVRAMRSVCAQ